jgi:hypothetical protein
MPDDSLYALSQQQFVCVCLVEQQFVCVCLVEQQLVRVGPLQQQFWRLSGSEPALLRVRLRCRSFGGRMPDDSVRGLWQFKQFVQ